MPVVGPALGPVGGAPTGLAVGGFASGFGAGAGAEAGATLSLSIGFWSSIRCAATGEASFKNSYCCMSFCSCKLSKRA